MEALLAARASGATKLHASLPAEWRVAPGEVVTRWDWLDSYQTGSHPELLLDANEIASVMHERARLVLGPLPGAPRGSWLRADRGGRGGPPKVNELFAAVFLGLGLGLGPGPGEAPERVPFTDPAPDERICFLDLAYEPTIKIFRTSTHWLRQSRQDPEINGVVSAYAIQPLSSTGPSLLALYEIWGRSMVVDPSGDNAQTFCAVLVGDGAATARASLADWLGRNRWRITETKEL
jgi:hypothetical protein